MVGCGFECIQVEVSSYEHIFNITVHRKIKGIEFGLERQVVCKRYQEEISYCEN